MTTNKNAWKPAKLIIYTPSIFAACSYFSTNTRRKSQQINYLYKNITGCEKLLFTIVILIITL